MGSWTGPWTEPVDPSRDGRSPGHGGAAHDRDGTGAVFTGCPQVEYAYSGVRPPRRRTIGSMLWSDPENEPPEDLRDMQDMLRRLGVLLAVAMVIAMTLVSIR